MYNYFLDFHQIETMMGITWTLASLCIFASSILLSAPLRPLTFLLRVNLEVRSWRSCRLNSYRLLNLRKCFPLFNHSSKKCAKSLAQAFSLYFEMYEYSDSALLFEETTTFWDSATFIIVECVFYLSIRSAWTLSQLCPAKLSSIVP